MLMDSIKEIGLQVPVRARAALLSSVLILHCSSLDRLPAQIDVLEVEGQIYGFSGCHRFEVRLASEQLPQSLSSLGRSTEHLLSLRGRPFSA